MSEYMAAVALPFHVRVNDQLIAAFLCELAAREFIDILCGVAEKGTTIDFLNVHTGVTIGGFSSTGYPSGCFAMAAEGLPL